MICRLLQLKNAGWRLIIGYSRLIFNDPCLNESDQTTSFSSSFHCKTRWADLVIKGEGRLDEQSMYGKVPIGIYAIKLTESIKKEQEKVRISSCSFFITPDSCIAILQLNFQICNF
ncbi:glycerate kinase [Bacillus sp. FJAT-52991]|uniref:Glycerate kinase n=1 Tax=Bacillus kandeliae TaxID=3129297 RepID=A0ABZ2NB25_9BACI